MSEAERLQKIVIAQEKEIRKLRRVLSTVRIAAVNYVVEGQALCVTVTCVGVDEYYFIEQAKAELEKIAKVICPGAELNDDITDAVTGDPIEGAVSLEP